MTLTGGEPLLFYEHTLAIVRAAAEIGMAPLRSIQSNASWCTADEMTRSRLTALRDAGLGGMLPMAARHGFRPRGRYAGKCHLCWNVREAIYKHYPELFAPEELYWD